MSNGEPDFSMAGIWDSTAVQQSAGDTMGYMGGINPRKTEQDILGASEASMDLKTGMMTLTLPSNKAQEILGKATQTDQIQALYAQKLADVQKQEAAVRAHPFANTLAQIAGAIAAGDRDPRVRSLGQLAQRVNPSLENLRGQELEIAGQAGAYQMKQEEMKLSQARETRLTESSKAQLGLDTERFGYQKERDKFNAEQKVHEKWDEMAVRGLFNPTTFAKELKATNPKITDDEVKALVSGKQELVKQAGSLREQLGKEGFEKFKREQGLKFQNDVKMAGIEHTNRVEEIVARNKGTMNPRTGKPFTQFELKEIAEMETTGILVDNLFRDLEEHPDLFGPMPQTRAKTWVKSFFDEKVSRVRADYAHALPIMVKLLQEGTRGYAQNQRQWVESKVPTTADTPERLKGKLAFIKGFLEARQAGLDKVFVTQDIARSQQAQGKSPFPVSSHGAAQPAEDKWTPEKVKALREKQSGGQ